MLDRDLAEMYGVETRRLNYMHNFVKQRFNVVNKIIVVSSLAFYRKRQQTTPRC